MSDDVALVAELTVTQAAEAVGVHRRTITRKLDAGLLPGAHRDGPGGTWLIPWTALLSAGYELVTPADKPSTPAPAPNTDELDRLRAQVAEWQARAQVAEAVATERERVIVAQELALRALTAGPDVTQAEPLTPAPSAPVRRWWHRR